MSNTLSKRQTLHPSRIAQFCKLGQCSMYLFHEYVDGFFDNATVDDVPLSPLYAETGMQFEQSQLEALLKKDIYSVGTDESPDSLNFDEHWNGDANKDMKRIQELVEHVQDGTISQPVVLYQTPLEVKVGVWPVRSEVDIVILYPTESGVSIRIVEIKSATTAKTHHQMQAAVYLLQFENLLDTEAELSASIVAQDSPLSAVVTSSGICLDRLETFEHDTRKNDISLLVEENGTFDELLYDADPSDPPNNRIDARCEGCSKQAKCFARGVTTHGLELLGTFGLSEGVQESLRGFGITKIDDIVDLYALPTDGKERKPYEYENLEPKDPDKVRRIQRETEISNLADLAQVAHRFLREIDPEFNAGWKRTADNVGPWSEYLVGSGSNLPEDNPYDEHWDEPWDEYPRKSLIRIYPYVQVDHVRDRVVLLAAKVTSTQHEEKTDNDGVFVIACPDGLPDDHDDAADEEKRLLEDFFEKLATAVDQVAPDLVGNPDHGSNDGYIHLYPYSNSQRDALMDAVKRHDNLYGSEAIQTMLGFRADIDQEAVSILQDDFRQRHALRYPGLGIVQTATQFFGGTDFSWENARNGGTPLKTVFAEGFFEVAVPFEKWGDRIVPKFDHGYQVPDADGNDYYKNHYPILGRHQDALPLEYIWGCDELNRMKSDWADNQETRDRIIRFRHHTDGNSERISLDDIEDMVEALCGAYQHIERCIGGKDAFTPKETIDIGNLANLSLGNSTLQSTVVEYQNLEFGTRQRDRENHYRKSLAERVAAGRAIPFECNRTPDDDDRQINGQIIRDIGDGPDSGLQAETPLAIESGDMIVMTPLLQHSKGSYEERVEKPQNYANSVLGFVNHVDTNAGTVNVSVPWQYRRSGEPCMVWHKGWTNDPDEVEDNVEIVQDGTAWVLDPAVDDFSGSRARQAIKYARQNDIHNRLLDLYDHNQQNALQYSTPFCSQSDLKLFLNDFDDIMDESTNKKQKNFVKHVNHSVVVAQGPPGTGKTSYGQAPATLGRAYAFEQENQAFGGVVSAHSNTAVDEAAEAVADAHKRLMEQKNILTDLRLIRVRSAGERLNHSNSNFEDLQYYEDRSRLRELWEETMNSDEAEQVIFFTTPVTLRNLVEAVAPIIDEDVNDLTLGNEDNVDALIRSGDARVFDYALIDEASMMDLPLLFLLGAFLRESRQLMLIGDHRQMRPIQSHDWESEDRKTIEEHTPSLSVLNLMRFLRGQTDDDETLEYLEREPPKWSNPDSVLPIVQFDTTYRFTTPMANLLTELFYHKDELDLSSGVDRPLIPDLTGNPGLPDWARAALDPEPRVTLLLHDDDQFTKDSPVEEAITNTLLEALPVTSKQNAGQNDVTAGVVVPFRLQRRRMQDSSPQGVTADTVERFQGDEKDVMVLSMTAGNQGYVNSRADFLLDENRFNVGISRMKRKVFIIASKSIFRAISPEVSEYERQKAWKKLYQVLQVGQRDPDCKTTFTRSEVPDLAAGREVNLEVYTGFCD